MVDLPPLLIRCFRAAGRGNSVKEPTSWRFDLKIDG
jgi:hypothetical protein